MHSRHAWSIAEMIHTPSSVSARTRDLNSSSETRYSATSRLLFTASHLCNGPPPTFQGEMVGGGFSGVSLQHYRHHRQTPARNRRNGVSWRVLRASAAVEANTPCSVMASDRNLADPMIRGPQSQTAHVSVLSACHAVLRGRRTLGGMYPTGAKRRSDPYALRAKRSAPARDWTVTWSGPPAASGGTADGPVLPTDPNAPGLYSTKQGPARAGTWGHTRTGRLSRGARTGTRPCRARGC